MQKERIPTAWIKERIHTCLEGAEDAKATAQRELAERLWPAAMHIAVCNQRRNRMLARYSQHIAEDAAMHAYTRFLETLHDQVRRRDVNGWFHTTIENFMQREVKRRQTEQSIGDISCFDKAAGDVPAESIELRIAFIWALKQLQVDYRHVIFLRYWGDFSRQQIAERWRVSKQHVDYVELQAISTFRHRAQKAKSRR